MKNVEAIIFDLGRVIIHLNEEATNQAFYSLSKKTPEEIVKSYNMERFYMFERGELSANDFRTEMKQALDNSSITDEVIDDAWNAMLGTIEASLIDLIKGIQDRQLFILSNTNEIHEAAFNRILHENTGHKNLDEVFNRVYLSHLIGARKPEKRSWQMILDQNNLDKAKTLFLDDRTDNIEAASRLGMQVIKITDPDHTKSILKKF